MTETSDATHAGTQPYAAERPVDAATPLDRLQRGTNKAFRDYERAERSAVTLRAETRGLEEATHQRGEASDAG